MSNPVVGIVMGSDSDFDIMKAAVSALDDFGIPSEVTVSSAHRTPAKSAEYARTARERGLKVIIAGAGMAAHLAGFMAAETTLPVIGVPIDAGPLKGLDALLATVQMPGGVPVATVSIGKAGAKNAGILAAQIIATADVEVAAKLTAYKERLVKEVEAKAKRIAK